MDTPIIKLRVNGKMAELNEADAREMWLQLCSIFGSPRPAMPEHVPCVPPSTIPPWPAWPVVTCIGE